ncbi:MAG: AAA family ATPase, partial [Muribaculaceae bacterium]|nr:AAA family ATPase [Muribaculaceae bacterium]
SGPSKRIYNYPEKALEEAITNAFYHRDYRSRTPIVVEVQPYEITISSATGPDRSIPTDAIQKGQRMVSRYYRNRRLGEFLKELSLTEGRNTGIPTIQRELAHNGSPAASFETDEDRLSFLVRIPCHEGEEGVSSAFMTSEASDKEVNNHDKENDKGPENYDKELQQRNLSAIQIELIRIVHLFPSITFNELAFKLNITVSALRNQRKQLESKGIFLCRKGATKKGTWEIKFD